MQEVGSLVNVNINYFPMLKQRLRDQYLQDWSTNIRASP